MLSQSNITSMVVTYVCTFLSAILIVTRLLFRFHRGERMYTDDTWMGISLVPLFVRLGIIHIVLIYGTNNIDFDKINVMSMSEEEINRRVVGSKLILASRVFYAGLWVFLDLKERKFMGVDGANLGDVKSVVYEDLYFGVLWAPDD